MKLPPLILATFLAVAIPGQADDKQTSPNQPNVPAKTVGMQVVNAAKINQFFTTYCVECHGEKKQKNQFRVDTLDYALTNVASAAAWQEVLDVLNLGDMPPKEKKQPPIAEYTEVLAALTDTIKAARQRLTSSGGKIALRHLNAREYAGTLEDLFGMRIPAANLPEEVNSEHFDTIGAGQYFTPFELERYFTLGKTFVEHALTSIAQGRKQAPLTQREEPEAFLLQKARKNLAEMRQTMALVKQGKSWQEAGFEGENVLKDFLFNYAAQEKRNMNIAESPDPETKTGVYFASPIGYRFFITRMMYPGATYKLRARGGIKGHLPGERTLLKITGEDETFGTLSFNSTIEQPEIVEMEFETKLDGENKNGFEIHGNVIKNNKQWGRYNKEFGIENVHSPVWLDWVEITGPFRRAPSFFETCMQPILDKNEPTDDEVKEILAKFTYRCFRQTRPSQAYLDGLFTLYQKNRQFGRTAKDAISDPLGVVLSSSEFLYLKEPSVNQKHELEQKSFAIRLAYFLWSAPPDDELYTLAAKGMLYQPEVLRSTVERMLSSPKARRFVNGFMDQWAELKKLDAIKTHEDFYQFMEVTRSSARREPAEFFNVLVKENLPVSNLIASDFAVIDKTLSVFYDIPGKFDHHFQKVTLPPDSPRGGLLGQAAFLVMNSAGDRTSPVTRGTFVLKKFLHREPAPPPPNVPALEISIDKPQSMRELTLLHETKPQCASCHNKIDPIGFGFENFDAIGLWRDRETVGKERRPIDASGTLPDGSRFSDFKGLRTALTKNEDKLARGLYEALSAYALGRRIDFTDETTISAALAELKPNHYPMKDMILSIATSQNFRSK